MSTPSKRIKANDINSVQSLDELKKNIARIGTLQAHIENITLVTEDVIKRHKDKLAVATKALNDEIKVLTKASQIYFSANQKDVVTPGKKSVRFEEGEIGTRTTPLSVTIKKAQEVDLITELLKRKLVDCVNITKTVNKNALKKCKDKAGDIPGITFNQKEEFFIAPMRIEADHIKDADEKEA
jgi:phage host-nuclease inhibitor protein Gam